MKTLSIRQPWAELVISGRKPIEVRTWKTDYRGPILVCAGKEIDYNKETWKLIGKKTEIQCGGILGLAWLYDVVALPWRRWQSLQRLHLNAADQFRGDQFGWFFSSVCRSTFREIDSALGLFELEPTEAELKLSKTISCGVNHDLINSKINLL